ncbi:MmcQ/YjbR family DNA-binding protein [Nocardioides dongxiaopingii]|uniref:MmcQ/YjbR family DNA-binding protein n=1 Tax=Nocardioides dongxiaopingii TaxID=2576036 RepID=UPI0010C76C99|nr:MmcQ/YjbR family DNA-binding protein [Nocardioides dongxiaopingii]
MTPEELAEHCASLPGCRRKGTTARPAWYVADRLVVRLEDPTTVTIRCTLAHRESLLAAHPETFGVPPSMERHEKVQAVLDRGDDDAVRDAVSAAHRLQRDR